jgi:hypothetical protein
LKPLQNLRKLTLYRFAESPTLLVELRTWSNETRRFHIHKDLLLQSSKIFHEQLLPEYESGPAVDLFLCCEDTRTFELFVAWLYGKASFSLGSLDQALALYHVSCDWKVVALEKQILKWCEAHCMLKDWLRLLQHMTESREPTTRLEDYVLAKLAYKITSMGWARFTQRSEGLCDLFISEPWQGWKGTYVLRLFEKLEAAEKRASEELLLDPAVAIYRWFSDRLVDGKRDIWEGLF